MVGPKSSVRRSQAHRVALIAVLAGGCVNLSRPDLQRPDASTAEAADATSSGGSSGGGGTGGQITGTGGAGAGGGSGGAGADAAAGSAGVDALDAAGGNPGVEAADAAVVVDAARADLGVDALVMGDLARDVGPDLGVDAPPAPPDLSPDMAPPPPVISFTESSTIVHAPGTGGIAFDGPCGGGVQALIGVTGTSGGVTGLNSVQGGCGALEVTGTTSYQLTTRASATVGPFGSVRATIHPAACPANQVVVGFEGSSGSWMNYMYVYCAGLTVTGSAGSYTVNVGAPFRVEVRLGTTGGTPFAARYCPAGQIATGMFGAAGGAIDRFGLHCARPVAR